MKLRILPLAAALSLAALLGGCAATPYNGSYYGYGVSYGTSYQRSYGYPYGGHSSYYHSRDGHRVHVIPAPTRDSGRHGRWRKGQHDRHDARPDRRHRSDRDKAWDDDQHRARGAARASPGPWRKGSGAVRDSRSRLESSPHRPGRNRAARTERREVAQRAAAGGDRGGVARGTERHERHAQGLERGDRPSGPRSARPARTGDPDGRRAREGRAPRAGAVPRLLASESAD